MVYFRACSTGRNKIFDDSSTKDAKEGNMEV